MIDNRGSTTARPSSITVKERKTGHPRGQLTIMEQRITRRDDRELSSQHEIGGPRGRRMIASATSVIS